MTKEAIIVLVEDDAGHRRLIQKNLVRGGLQNEIVPFENGRLAMDYLMSYVDAPPPRRPLLMLLDLNMPVMDGYQVLAAIKNDDRLAKIPVIVLTTTDNPGEIDRCFDLGCNVYVSKPVEYEDFAEAIVKLGSFVSVMKISDRTQKGTTESRA